MVVPDTATSDSKQWTIVEDNHITVIKDCMTIIVDLLFLASVYCIYYIKTSRFGQSKGVKANCIMQKVPKSYQTCYVCTYSFLKKKDCM